MRRADQNDLNQADDQNMERITGKSLQRKKKVRLIRFIRGYLMIVGALTTLYVLMQLIVILLVELGRWMPPVQ